MRCFLDRGVGAVVDQLADAGIGDGGEHDSGYRGLYCRVHRIRLCSRNAAE